MKTEDIVETLLIAAKTQENIALAILLKMAAERLKELCDER